MIAYEYLLMMSDMILILCGATMYWFCPKLRRNWLLGYGSPRSMVNDMTWQAANRFAGMSLALLTLIGMSFHVTMWPIINDNDLSRTISVAALLSLPLVVMFLTEKYLARVFRN